MSDEEKQNELVNEVMELRRKLKELEEAYERNKEGMTKEGSEENKTNDVTINVPRMGNPPFVLNENTNYDVWLTVLKNELQSILYDYLIDETKEKPTTTREEENRRIGFAKSFILTRVCEEYKKRICNEKTPSMMIKKLNEVKYPLMVSTRFAARRAWNSINFNKGKETATEFNNRFDDIKKNLEKQNVEVNEDEVKENFLMATELGFPEVNRKNDASQGKLSIDELKTILITEEAREKEIQERANEGMANTGEVEFKKKERSDKVCYRCGKINHKGFECTNPKRICYNCKEISDHISKECTKEKVEGPNRVGFRGKLFTRSAHYAGRRAMYRGRRSSTIWRRSPYTRRTWVRSRNYGGNRRYRGGRNANNQMYRRVKLMTNDREGISKYAFMAIGDESTVFVEDYKDMEMNYADANEEVSANQAENKTGKYIKFIVDTGATEHLVNDLNCLTNVIKLGEAGTIRSANKDEKANLKVEYKGTIITTGENGETIKFGNVMYAKNLSKNLFAVRKLMNKGVYSIIDGSKIVFINKKNKRIIKQGVYDGKFWWLNFELKNVPEGNKMNNEIISMYNQTENKNDKNQAKQTDNKNEGSMMKNIEGKRKSYAESEKYNNESKIRKKCDNVNQEHDYCTMSANSNTDHEYSKSKDSEVNREKELQTHEYTKLTTETSELNPTVSYKDISDKETLRKYLTAANEMKLYDLKELGKNKVESLRDDIGLLWHIRLGHVSKTYLEKAAKIIPELRGVKFKNSIIDCEVCKLAKARKTPSNTIRYRYNQPLKLIHTDLMGPIAPCTYKYGARYIITFIDDCTRYAWAYPLHDKTTVHIALEKVLEDARNIRGQSARIGKLRLDGGTEYLTESMKRLSLREKIQFETTPPGTPDLNGCAERFNLELQQKIRSLIFSSGFPKQMWAYALQFAINVYNKTPKSSIEYKIPFELMHDKPCTIKYFRRFGSLCYILNLNNKNKFDERAIEGFLIGCGENKYQVIQPSTGKVYKTKYLSCIESKTYGDVFNKTNKIAMLNDPPTLSNEEGSDWFETSQNAEMNENCAINMLAEVRENFALLCDECEEREHTCTETLISETEREPQSYEEAMNSENKNEWLRAIDDEFGAHNKNETWTLTKRTQVSKNEAIMKSRWLFKRKENNLKARLVIKGYADKNNYDLTQTYAPVARMCDVRFLLIIANKYRLEIHQLDVKTAFLNGYLEKRVFMEIPEGHKGRDELKEKYVCELRKALYGLKVSPRRWYERFKETIRKLGFEVYVFQACLFTWRKEGKFVVLLLYVDDILITGNCKNKINQVKHKLATEFETKDLGKPSTFLGIEITRDYENNEIVLHQRKFILKILEKFGMSESKPVKTPMITRAGEKKGETEGQNIKRRDEKLECKFREAIGSLIYVSNGTRPDIAYAVNRMSRKQSNYNYEDWLKVKRIFRYLKGTANLGLKYTGKGEKLECFVDASLGTGDEESKSTSGLIVKLFDDIIFWRTKKQTHVALSSAEAEYIAMSLACKELICVKEMCARIIKVIVMPIMYEDNQAAINIAKSDDSQTLKHIVKLCYHYVRFEVSKRNLIIKWVSTNDQLADGLTKALGHKKFEKFKNKMLTCINT